MAARKATELESTPNLPLQDTAEDSQSDDKREDIPEDVAVKSIAIEEHVDTGDPYNNTGQYVILEMKKDE